jgi:hypothetical protein
MLKRIKEIKHKKVAVFVTFLTKTASKVWKENSDLKEFQKTKAFKLLLFMRHDGRFGFIGGSKEEKESLFESLIREVKEEMPYLEKIVENKLKKKEFIEIIHTNGKRDFILFVIKVNNKEFEQIFKKACKSIYESKFKELLGINIIPIYELKFLPKEIRKRKDKGIYSLFKHSFATAVKEEILCIMKELLPKEEFEEIAEFSKLERRSYEIRK